MFIFNSRNYSILIIFILISLFSISSLQIVFAQDKATKSAAKSSSAGGAGSDDEKTSEPIVDEETVIIKVGEKRTAKFGVQSYIKKKPENTDPSIVEITEFKEDFGLTIKGLNPGRSTITTLIEKVGFQSGIDVPLQKNTLIKKIFKVVVIPVAKPNLPERFEENITLVAGQTSSITFDKKLRIEANSSAITIAGAIIQGNKLTIKAKIPGKTVIKATAKGVIEIPGTSGAPAKRDEVNLVLIYNVRVIESRPGFLPLQSFEFEFGKRADDSYFRGRLQMTPGYSIDLKKKVVRFFWFAGVSKEKDFFNLQVLEGRDSLAPGFLEQKISNVRATFDNGETVPERVSYYGETPIPMGATKLIKVEMEVDFGGGLKKSLVWSDLGIHL